MHPEAAIFVHNYLHLVGITLFFYDYILTFPDEIERVWKRLRARGSWWFLLNRYLAFVGSILVSVFNFIHLSPEGCARYSILRQALIVLTVCIVGAILTIRTYALWNRSKVILAIILGPAAVLFSVACWSLIAQQGSEPFSSTLRGCHVATTPAQARRIAVAWECLFAFDTLLFVLTAARAFTLAPSSPSTSRSPFCRLRAMVQATNGLDLVGIVWRDGAVYYAVMALCNLANVITFYASEPLLKGVLSTPSSAVLAALCARLMLNIHDSAAAGGPSTSARNQGRPLRTTSSAAGDTTAASSAGAAFTSQFELGADLASPQEYGERWRPSEGTAWSKRGSTSKTDSKTWSWGGGSKGSPRWKSRDEEERWEMADVGK